MTEERLYDQYPWALTYFYGITTKDALFRMAKGSIHRWPEDMLSFEVAHSFEKDNWFRWAVTPLVGISQIAFDFGFRHGQNQHDIYEFAPYLSWRWTEFPWDRYVTTSLAIGEGVSYTSAIPSLEKRSNTDTKRLLNFLMLEATFASPVTPRLQLAVRLHHRSGAYGLYHAGNTGSNVIGLGLRVLV